MNKKYVISLELSQTLEKLGVKQISEFYWVKHEQWKDTKKGMRKAKPIYKLEQWGKITAYDHCSAFLSGELGEMLKKYDIDYWYSYPDFRLKLVQNSSSDARHEREVEARGLMVEYLKRIEF